MFCEVTVHLAAAPKSWLALCYAFHGRTIALFRLGWLRLRRLTALKFVSWDSAGSGFGMHSQRLIYEPRNLSLRPSSFSSPVNRTHYFSHESTIFDQAVEIRVSLQRLPCS